MTDSDLMPFGKYKGTKMANVPAKYLIWLYENTDNNFRGAQEVSRYTFANMDVLKKQAEEEKAK